MGGGATPGCEGIEHSCTLPCVASGGAPNPQQWAYPIRRVVQRGSRSSCELLLLCLHIGSGCSLQA